MMIVPILLAMVREPNAPPLIWPGVLLLWPQPSAELAFDFAAGLPEGFTFTRASGQMVRNASGVATWLANDAYPLHYDAAGVALGALLERSGQNKQASSAVATASVGSSVSTDAIVAPNGATEADLCTEDISTGNHSYVFATAARSADEQNLLSIFVKSNGRDWARMSATAAVAGYFDVQTGAAGFKSTDILAMWAEPWANGWMRCTIRTKFASAGSGTPLIRMATASETQSYAGNGTSGQYAWGCDYVQGWYPTSHIPTAGAAVTRAPTALSGTFAARRPATIRVKGRAPLGVQPDADQFVCALTGDTEADLIEVYRDYTDRHVMVYFGSTSIDLGEVLDGAAFDLTATLTAAPEVDKIYVGTNALGAKHWDATIKEIIIT